VVDDHQIVRQRLRGFLNGEPDVEVVGEAADGRQALEELAWVAAESLRERITSPRRTDNVGLDGRARAGKTASAQRFLVVPR
jgi:DNA-binding NarL/FixJ family response regulator